MDFYDCRRKELCGIGDSMTLKVHVTQAGQATITTDVSGDGTASVTMDNPIDDTYVVVVTPQSADLTGVFYVSSLTDAGFTVGVKGSTVTSGTVTVGWIAKRI